MSRRDKSRGVLEAEKGKVKKRRVAGTESKRGQRKSREKRGQPEGRR